MIKQSNEATKLRDAFCSALNGPFGIRSLTVALEKILPQISEARGQKVNWQQIVSQLNEAILLSDGNKRCLDEATLRGIFGRLGRRAKSSAQRPTAVSVAADQTSVQPQRFEHTPIKTTLGVNQTTNRSASELSLAQRVRAIIDLS